VILFKALPKGDLYRSTACGSKNDSRLILETLAHQAGWMKSSGRVFEPVGVRVCKIPHHRFCSSFKWKSGFGN